MKNLASMIFISLFSNITNYALQIILYVEQLKFFIAHKLTKSIRNKKNVLKASINVCCISVFLYECLQPRLSSIEKLQIGDAFSKNFNQL